MGLKDYTPILKVVRSDPEYTSQFKKVFGRAPSDITIDDVASAIAAFERTIISGNSHFDRYQYGGEANALNDSQLRGLQLFTGKGRCVSCHRIEQTTALFTDHRFHNIGVGFKRIRGKEAATAAEFLQAKHAGADVDITVLTQENMSELGRFAVTENGTQVGAFKTPTLRNIAVTQPYMHDGSLETLEDVITFYNNGGREEETDHLSPFMSGGIKPLDLSDAEQTDLVNFLKALTSPEYAPLTMGATAQENLHAKN